MENMQQGELKLGLSDRDTTTTHDEQATKSIMKKDGNSGAVVSNTPEPELTRMPQVMFQESKQEETEKLGKKLPMTSNTVVSAATEVLKSIIDTDKYNKETVPVEKEHPHFLVQDELHTPTGQLSPQRSIHSDAIKFSPIQSPVLAHIQDLEPTTASASIISSFNGENVSNIPKREMSKNIDVRLPTDDGKKHILIGCCGTPGIFKLKLMIKKIEDIYGKDNVSIQVILTFSARRFFAKKLEQQQKITTGHKKSPLPSGDIPAHIRVWNDLDEWDAWKQRNDPVLHIELRRWADILLIAPLTANTLAKISLGLCDNLLTCVVRAWNPGFPIFLAPSMISSVYNAPITKKQVAIIKDDMPWITILKPSEKIVGIHGDIGLGGMMDINEIVDKVVSALGGYPQGDSSIEDKNDDDDMDDDDDDDAEDDDRNINAGNDDDDDTDDDDDDDDDDDEATETKTL